MTSYYLGVDAGNSKTVALVADRGGRILGRGRGGVGDIYGTASEGDAVEEVLAAVHGALTGAGVTPDDVDQAAFRLAGVDWAEDESFWRAALATRLPGLDLNRASVKNDGFAVLRCGEVNGTGVAITAGSGPAVAARGWDGREYCASWWIQHSLAGNGLGEAAFRAVVDAEIGLAPATDLRADLLGLFGFDDVTAMVYGFTRRVSGRTAPLPHKRVAARSVLRSAGNGDAVALAIVNRQARIFAGLARVAAEQTGLVGGDSRDGRAVPVVLGGSVLTSEYPVYRDALREALLTEVGPIEPASYSASPVAGALLDALAEGGIEVEDSVQDRVLTAVHPTDFLLT